jgi:hypothetical protein
MMLTILERAPQITVVSLAMLSVFTVGYFSKVGVHLLGVIDVTNLVYSFGLAFGFVTFVVVFVNGDTTRFLRWAAKDDDLLPMMVKGWNRILSPIVLVCYALYFISPRPYVPRFFGSDGFIFLVMILSVLWLSVIIFVRYEQARAVYGSEVSSLVVLIVLTVFNAGRLEAHEEIFAKKDLYEIVLKDSTIKDARIVRTSSSGFIIAINGIVKYLPKDEVRMLSAQTQIE